MIYLTEHEREVERLRSFGLKPIEIATRLNVSEARVNQAFGSTSEKLREPMAKYKKACKDAAQIVLQASIAASQRRNREYEALRTSSSPESIEVMIRIEKRYDIACEKAGAQGDKLIKAAHEKVLIALGKLAPTERPPEQQSLFEALI